MHGPIFNVVAEWAFGRIYGEGFVVRTQPMAMRVCARKDAGLEPFVSRPSDAGNEVRRAEDRPLDLSDPDMDSARVHRAARIARIHEDIMQMPMGYETLLTDRGLSLSGGQRQRLALARALANDPALLILDEATNQLDAITEERVNRSLSSLRCTRIVIADRLSTIRDADLILVMDAGRIVESGRHEDLLTRGDTYCALIGEKTGALTVL